MAGERILLVDDDKTIRKLVSSLLERQGYLVRTAENGLDALRAAGEDTPDLVITDVRMPQLDGLELTQRLRQNARTARIPIIMLSERKRSDDVLAGYAEGADDYVPKPVDVAVLAAKARALLQRARPAAEAAPRPAEGIVVAFLRGKGGVGTTTLAVNCGVALTASGLRRVTLVDLNLEFGCGAMMLDLQPERTLADLAETSASEVDERTFGTFAVRHESGLALVVGSNSPETAELVSSATVAQTLARLRAREDFVLIDLPTSFSETTLAALDAADIVCLVTTPHLTAVKAMADCQRVLGTLQVPDSRVRLVLNQTTPGTSGEELIGRALGRKPDAVIPYIPQCDAAADAGRPLVLQHAGSPGALALEWLAGRLTTAVAVAA